MIRSFRHLSGTALALFAILAGTGLARGTAPAAQLDASAEEVDLELVLATDVSYSVDFEEAKLQRIGYIEAIQHPSVIAAIQSGVLGRIVVTYVEWADEDYQNQLIGWTVISDRPTAQAFAAKLSEAPIRTQLYTAIGSALVYCAGLIEANAFEGLRKVIDISGDGTNNEGRWLYQARAAVLAQGITINGLPILNDRPQPGGLATPRQMKLDEYFKDEVIGGPGAFIVAAEGFSDFRAAILSKMIREIAHAPATPRQPARTAHSQASQERRPAPDLNTAKFLPADNLLSEN